MSVMETSGKHTTSSKLEETLVSTFPRICQGCSQLTNKQIFLTDPAFEIKTLKQFVREGNESYLFSKMALEESYEGEMYLILSLKQAITISGLLLCFEDDVVRENAHKGEIDADGRDAFKEFANQVCGLLDNELRAKLPKPIHLKLLSTTLINGESAENELGEELLNEESLILTAKIRIIGFDDDLFMLSVSKIIGEEFFGEIIEDERKQFKGTLLAVDNSNADLRIIRKLLSSEYKIITTNNANDVLSALQKTKIDLLLLNDTVGGVDGISLCARIKRNAICDEIPIVICSSSPTQENVIRAVRAGARDFIVKPHTRQKLSEKIKKYMMEKHTY
ncbi:MAG: response regulator [Candidatus Brocadiaceae bacterium]|nr:response regulator [Candidatus Brocadiaceae bacterium]